MMQKIHIWFLLALSTAITACTTVQFQPVPGIERVNLQQGYRITHALEQQQLAGNQSDIFVAVMFSGGGTRAAALGYGVLEEMRRQYFDWHGQQLRLADQIDITFGVSGGSILSAAYALEGDNIFPRFERRFLKNNLQGILLRNMVNIANWPRLTSPQYGRGDLLQEQLDQTLYHGATFADLTHRRKGPMSVISATDMSTGGRFAFTQETFDVLCLNLEHLPVARAVAASSAVPLLFAPLTLNNRGGQCQYQLPPQLQHELAASSATQSSTTRTRADIVNSALAYAADSRRPWLHLLDGGLTDNLALRGIVDAMQVYSHNSLHQHLQRARHVVLISVNAQNALDTSADLSANVPGTRSVMQALINIPIDSNSQQSLRQLRLFVDQWRHAAAQRTSHDADAPDMPTPEIHLISLQLGDLADTQLRQSTLGIATTLHLPPAQIDLLRHAGSELLRRNPDFIRLQHMLGLQRRP